MIYCASLRPYLRSHDTLLTTLTKWSTKIQAASIQQAMLAGKAAGNGNKFSAGAGQAGVVEAIDGALNSKVRTLGFS